MKKSSQSEKVKSPKSGSNFRIYLNFVFLILAFIILAGCSTDNDISFEGKLDLPSEYSYEVTLQCFCLVEYVGPHMLRIKDNKIVDYSLLNDSNEPIDDRFIRSLTIDALVQRVNEMIAQDPVTKNIVNHPVYNFPTSVWIDIDELIADEEWGFEIINFKVIKE